MLDVSEMTVRRDLKLGATLGATLTSDIGDGGDGISRNRKMVAVAIATATREITRPTAVVEVIAEAERNGRARRRRSIR